MTARRTASLGLLSSLALVAACSVSIGGDLACDVTGQRAVELDADALRLLDVTAAAGSLEVEGRPDLGHVRVRGEACASNAELLEQVRLEGSRDGERAVVRVEMPDLAAGERAELDLTMELPSTLRVRIRDGSGPATIRGVAGVTIDDASGSLTIVDIDGPVEVDDGSGSAEIRSVRGDVVVTDGSGSLEVLEVTGSVRVDDGSGGLTIRGVGGDVTVSDGSGAIHVAGVAGDLIVEEDGSGDLETEGVSGEVIVR